MTPHATNDGPHDYTPMTGVDPDDAREAAQALAREFQVHAYAAARSTERHRRRNSQVTVTRVDPRVWKTAVRAANGDVHRIRIISATEVLITNRGRA